MSFTALQHCAEIFSGGPAAADPVVLCGGRLAAAVPDGGGLRLPTRAELGPELPEPARWLRLGDVSGRRCFAAVLPELTGLPPEILAVPGRRMLAELPDAPREAFCRGRELAMWSAAHRFCGGCRAELRPAERDMALVCPDCGLRYYPQLAPAVIVAVTRNSGSELLLAHNRGFEPGVYSLIAGFVEAGESVEAAVRRELREECGIAVRDIRYLTSQVWPFPNSLMLAFAAEYASGAARPDGEELSDLGWFTAADHPRLPGAGSVARRVIETIFGPGFR